MFREMRRKKQQLSPERVEEILSRRTAGTLAVLGDEGYPYAVPLSYVYHNGRIYFHCAKAGHKLDAIRGCDKVSFCVIDQDEIVSAVFTTYFRSVIVFGRAREVSDPAELMDAMKAFAGKYSPKESEDAFHIEMKVSKAALCVLAIDIEHKTGKEAIELVKKG